MKNFIDFLIIAIMHAGLGFLVVNEYLTAITIIGFIFLGIAAIFACYCIGCFVYAMFIKSNIDYERVDEILYPSDNVIFQKYL